MTSKIIKKLLKELECAYKIAEEKKETKEMLNIVMAKAKLLGLDLKEPLKEEKEELKQALVKFIE